VRKAIIFEANKTVLEEYPMNERRPDSPSRADGIDPNCNLCDGEGKFEATVAWGQRLDMEADTAPRLTVLPFLRGRKSNQIRSASNPTPFFAFGSFIVFFLITGFFMNGLFC
jgi:hypothetical protein